MGTDIEIVVSGRGSDSCDFNEPIDISIKDFDARLDVKKFSTFNNIPNIEDGRNNKLKIKVPGVRV